MNLKAFQDHYKDEYSVCYGCGRLNPHGHQIKSYWDGEESDSPTETVGFVGQIPVRVRGSVETGDYIVASGLEDGTAIAVPVERISPEQGRLIVGRAWEASDEVGVKLITTVIGLPESASTSAALTQTVRSQHDEIVTLQDTVSGLEARIQRLEALLSNK